MSRVKSFRLGRSSDNAIHLVEDTVSRHHAEIVFLENGDLYVTDCCSTSGTHVLRDQEWEQIRQDFVRPQELLRFGEFEVLAGELRNILDMGFLAWVRARSAGGDIKVLNDSKGLKRDPGTGELIEKED